MKKILLISNMYPSKKYPHYGVFVKNMADNLSEGGYAVTICSMPKCDWKWEKLACYLKLYIKSVVLGLFGKYDCVYAHFVSHTAMPVRILKKLKKSLVLVENAHGNDVLADSPLDLKNIPRSRKALRIADWVVVPSAYYKRIVVDEFSVAEEKVFISPSGGVDPQVFFPTDTFVARKHIQLEEAGYWVGYISRLEKGKGWDTFLQACAKLIRENSIPDMKILVVGNGAEKSAFQEEIQKLSLENYVEHRDFAPQKNLRYYYCALDVFCFPSERKSESLGLVGLEAMACGAPCICSDAGGIKSYAEDGRNCLMFAQGNAEELAEKIQEMYNMKCIDMETMKAMERKTASEYDRGKIRQSFLNFFDEKVIPLNEQEKQV